VSRVVVRAADEGTRRCVVVERAGRVGTVEGRSVVATFLDFGGGERGRRGLPFAPDFTTSHRCG